MKQWLRTCRICKKEYDSDMKYSALCPNCRKDLNTSHFAVFPPELIETPIKAGCPRFICKKCGKIREKIYETDNPSGKIEWHGEEEKNSGRQSSSSLHRNDGGVYSSAKFIGMSDCGCNAGFTGGVVIDTFVGSGTTMLVAEKLGMNSIGIEINPVYVEMIKGRLKPYLNQMRLDGSKSTLEAIKEEKKGEQPPSLQ